MARKLTNNNAHFKRAVQRLPLGVASNFRYWGDDRTIYVKHGKGARIVDLDDNAYVDYRMGYGPAILGYADDRVDAAAPIYGVRDAWFEQRWLYRSSVRCCLPRSPEC